ncbi:hypothetical protein N7497_012235 [Penicillium chrysogenum]|nr:hypothetical protein N7497_012235 [Penicillium chrysogenum]
MYPSERNPGANIACGGAAQTSYDSATTHRPGDLAFSVSLALAQVVASLSSTENYKFRAVTAVVAPDTESEHPPVGCMDSASNITNHILHSAFGKTSQSAKQKSSTRQQFTSSNMPGPDIFRQIISLIEVTEDMIGAFSSIENLPSLPEAFQEANKRLPLVEQILRDAKRPAKKLKSAKDAQELEIVLHSFHEKANKLLEIVEKNWRRLKSWIRFIYGKQRVETLMDGLLEDLGTLIANRVFLGEMQKQIEPLTKAREELAEVSCSLAESDVAHRPRAANQYGANSRQYNLFGGGTQKITEGHYFEAHGNQNFGIVPPTESI